MQLSSFETLHKWDFSDKRVMISISGGINSAAVLCYVKKFVQKKPKELHLVYCHLEEHSPDTLPFVEALFEYGKEHFKNVHTHIERNSVIDLFKESKMIPAPMFSPCTRLLKILPMAEYMENNRITIDLVGYVREEDRRIVNQIGTKLGIKKLSRKKLEDISRYLNDMKVSEGEVKKSLRKKLTLLGIKNVKEATKLINAYHNRTSADGKKAYPISHMTDDDCFGIVQAEIGWFPKLYSLRWNDERIPKFFEENGHLLIPEQFKRLKNKIGTKDRIFLHNNCLPCKNMQSWEFMMVKLLYPEYYMRALKLQNELENSEWGRKADSLISSELACSYCTFD